MMFAEALALTDSEAYGVQARVAALREARGEQVIGYKVGCTSKVIQQQVGIAHPVFGRLFASERHHSGVRLSMARFDHLGVEGELAVRLAVDFPDRQRSSRDTEQAIECVFPVIELHNYGYRRPAPSSPELIANNCMHAGFVMPAQLPDRLEAVAGLTIRVDGELVGAASGAELTAGIDHALEWLAETLLAESLHLKAGQAILTGSRPRLIPIDSTGRIVVEAPPFPTVEAEITP